MPVYWTFVCFRQVWQCTERWCVSGKYVGMFQASLTVYWTFVCFRQVWQCFECWSWWPAESRRPWKMVSGWICVAWPGVHQGWNYKFWSASTLGVLPYSLHKVLSRFSLKKIAAYCKTPNFRDSIYYVILAPLIFAFLLAGLSNTLKELLNRFWIFATFYFRDITKIAKFAK